ncbi:EF-hand calcium-binding domain-containing protein 12-like [Polyodon spathula]|uniref:EF-hand calcium-binding domain-containing protein 12-like n=1 Tax=Polyodon spathula TaxID=7913 RepID=UPI001B7E17B4|nr:EF-hand calcium-binding domain-containing protein 12-like [Polyodon spathula]
MGTEGQQGARNNRLVRESYNTSGFISKHLQTMEKQVTEATEGTDATEEGKPRYRQRDLFQTHFFRAAAKSFGAPKSRRRVLVAPPMLKCDPEDRVTIQTVTETLPDSDYNVKTRGPPDTPDPAASALRTPAVKKGLPTEPGEDEKGRYQKWLTDRRQTRTELDSLGNVDAYLRGKHVKTDLEKAVVDRIRNQRRVCRGLLRNSRAQPSGPTKAGSVRSKPRAPPKICSPSPLGMGVLVLYLQKEKLRLLDLFHRVDKTRRGKVTREDFKLVIDTARIPLDKQQLDQLIVSLSCADTDLVSYKELVEGRNAWNQEARESCRNEPLLSEAEERFNDDEAERQSATVRPSPSPRGSLVARSGVPLTSPGDRLKTPVDRVKSPGDRLKTPVDRIKSPGDRLMSPGSSPSRLSSGSQFLEVPPTELSEGRPLSYEDMEDIGKWNRERRRRSEIDTNSLVWREQCRLVRTGNAAIDSHALPSTLGGEDAEAVNRFRRSCFNVYMDTMQLCQRNTMPQTMGPLEKGLLYPGDKLIARHRSNFQGSGHKRISRAQDRGFKPEHRQRAAQTH